MKQILSSLLLSTILMSCNSRTFDLSTINFETPANVYLLKDLTSKKSEQKGHYKIKKENNEFIFELVDGGERVTNYSFTTPETISQLNYKGIQLDPNSDAKFSIYENKIAYMHITTDFKTRLKLFDVLKNKLGSPTEITTGKTNLSYIDVKMQKLFLEKFPNETKLNTDDGYISFPEKLRWIKDDILYILSFNVFENAVESDLIVISKKALNDKIIAGYQNSENDSLIKKYLNK